MKPKRTKRPHGQIRQGQVITTFGPGAPLDLPDHAVLVGGLDHWKGTGAEINEPRLLEKLKRVVDRDDLRFYAPPPDDDDPSSPMTGITAWQFPEWFITQDVQEFLGPPLLRSRRLIHRTALTKGKFIDDDKKKLTVVPIRFVRACRRGHIADISWYGFVHAGPKDCRRPLRLVERGTSGDLADVFVRCECGDSRSIQEASVLQNKALGSCEGWRPWLGPYTKEQCGEPCRLLVRMASNAYFPQIMSVISLPGQAEALEKAVGQVWETYLQYVDDLAELEREREKKPPVAAALGGFSSDEVFAEIQARKGIGSTPSAKSVKQAEFETLSAAKDEIGENRPDGNFFARNLPRPAWDVPLMDPVDRVVLVHRLREVSAQVGFTRFEASAPDVEGELELGVRRAALSRDESWLPAIENRGEGFFLSIKPQAIEDWLAMPAVVERRKHLEDGFKCWKQDHSESKREFFGLPYVLLHSLSHLLITAVSLECGYPASSIRERIYAGPWGYGLLLYTASPDAEGTLGGLVQVGRKIHVHLERALELGRLCSNDPVCAQHEPDNQNEYRFLHGAACHGCLLIAETCCEQHNDFLDRATIVQTVSSLSAEFFRQPTP